MSGPATNPCRHARRQGEHPEVIRLHLIHLADSSTQVSLDPYGDQSEGLDETAADRLDAAFPQAPVDIST